MRSRIPARAASDPGSPTQRQVHQVPRVPYATPPTTAAGKAGCIISDPLKNGRRARFLTQSPADAGPGGINIAIFWREGIYDKGGPADIVLRRGMGGLQPANMVPAIDPACATSDYPTAAGLANTHAENVSSNTPSATSGNLTDDTELNNTENALAHRGLLRGEDLWVGWTYTGDLTRLRVQLDNYNFWLRKYTGDQGWGGPVNVTKIEDRTINVREPRMIGTPKSSQTACPAGNPQHSTTTDPTLCQNADVMILGWGTQENVPPELGWGSANNRRGARELRNCGWIRTRPDRRAHAAERRDQDVVRCGSARRHLLRQGRGSELLRRERSDQ